MVEGELHSAGAPVVALISQRYHEGRYCHHTIITAAVETQRRADCIAGEHVPRAISESMHLCIGNMRRALNVVRTSIMRGAA